MTDIQNKIKAASEKFGKSLFGQDVNMLLADYKDTTENFVAGANYVLQTSELMKEAMVDMLDWLHKEGYYNWSLEDVDINSSEIADLYIKHLKSATNG